MTYPKAPLVWLDTNDSLTCFNTTNALPLNGIKVTLLRIFQEFTWYGYLRLTHLT